MIKKPCTAVVGGAITTKSRVSATLRERPSIILFMRAQRSRFLVVSQGLGPAAKPPRKHNNNNVIILYIVHCLTAAAPPSSCERYARVTEMNHDHDIIRLKLVHYSYNVTFHYGAAVVVVVAAADIVVVIVIIIFTRRV